PEYRDGDGYRGPSNATEEILAGIYAQVLGLDQVSVDDSFFDLGGNSLSAMRVIAAVNRAFDTRIPVSSMFTSPSVESLSRQLGTRADAAVAPVELLHDGVGTPLICIHDGFGFSWSYRTLANYLDCPIVGINQIESDDEGEPDSVHSMAVRYADRIQAAYPDGPYKLLGWSVGAVIAHEVAIELQRRRCVVDRLVLLDPASAVVKPLLTRSSSHDRRILDELMSNSGMRLSAHSKDMVSRRVADLVGNDENASLDAPLPLEELVNQMARNIEANRRRLRGYRAGIFNGDIVLFVAGQRVATDTRWPTSSSRMAVKTQVRRWRRNVTGAIAAYPVKCTHYAMLAADALKHYGEDLKRSLG
ncbi:thioesterase domain-containing protein, partial [Mycolicibacterium wolinskyi]